MDKLGFGLMRLPLTDPKNPASLDMEKIYPMVDKFLEEGFTYFDTAWMYCGFESEKVIKKALVERHPRDSFTVTTKMHSAYFKDAEDREEVFKKQLEKTGVEYFDYYLLHDVNAESLVKYEKYHSFEWLAEKKKQGLVKHIGFSYHDNAQLLDRLLTEHPEIEYVQIQLNYLDWDSRRVQSGANYETVARHGRQLFIMEPVKGGALANPPHSAEKLMKEFEPDSSPASWAIRFAASLPAVKIVLSGMSSLEQVADNTATMRAMQPLSDEQREMLFKAAKMIKKEISIECTGCSYCTDGCPRSIPIPGIFALYNAAMKGEANKDRYKELVSGKGKAGSCAGCGHCESVCPQHLSIRSYLKLCSEHFDH